MSLASGARLGAYEIVSPLGAGGMGEVYRAHDTTLGRDVALKTLPPGFTQDPERLARFRREAQVLAALNHPHIAGIYGLEESGGHRFLVLELVEGETLAAMIARGPLPVDDALSIAREIAEALEAAHEKGIIHRDLKPANIALTSRDRVKVLDFGLAKATEPAASGAAPDALNSPTITSPMTLTAMGVILGTAAYMSPEQAKGRVADKRSDIWAFGCVLYEMLTGRRAFKGDDVTDTLAAVLRSEPDWSALPSSVPPAVRALLEGCLAKHHRDRIGDISAARFVLKQPFPTASVAQPLTAPRPARSRWATALLVLAAVAAGAAVTAIAWPRPQPPALPVTRFTFALPAGSQLTQSRRVVAISPDGTRIVYTADGRLYSRLLSDLEPRPIPGAEPGVHAAFSPDGKSIVFWADPALMRMPVEGGVPVTVCETSPAPFGISWTEHGIVFVQPGVGVMRVSPNGGKAEELVRFGPGEGLAHGAQLLPDGQTLIFALASLTGSSASAWDKARIVAHSLPTGTRTTLIEGGSDAHYLSSGHLVYMLEGTLMAVPFDASALKVGRAVPVVEGIRRAGAAVGGAGHFAVSRTGVLAYVPGPARGGQDGVFLYDRRGGVEPLKLPRGQYSYPRVSPDGKWIAFETGSGKETAVALFELSGASSARRLTFGGNNRLPIWSRDGKHVVFQSDRDGDAALFWQPVDGGAPERLTRPDPGVTHVADAWSPTEDAFLFSATKGNETSLWIYSMRDRKAVRFPDVRSIGAPTNAVFSSDGKWIAYQTGDATAAEAVTFVQPFPATGRKFEIGRGGRSVWSRTNELFFVPAPSLFMAVTVTTTPSFSFTAPVSVPRRFGLAPPTNPRPYDLLADGRFVAVDAAGAADPRSASIHVVLNWFEELKSKM